MAEECDCAKLLDSLAPILKDKRLVSSPMLRGLPPAQYMQPFLKSPGKPLPAFQGMEGFYAMASVVSNLLTGPLGKEHMKIINVMHAEKRLRHREYIDKPQDALVSVVMPTRNRADAIEGAVLSVLVQSYRNWELIIVDDGGEQSPEKIIAAFNDPRIKYIRLEESGGAALARNVGLENAKGDYVAYLDDDDQWDPDFLLISCNEMIKHKRRFVYSAQMVWADFDPESNLGCHYVLVRYVPFNRSSIENSNYISMISCMHEKSLCEEAGNFNAAMKRGQDWEFFLRLTEVADAMEIPCILSHYYMFRCTQSVSRGQSPLLMAHRTIMHLRERAAWRQKMKGVGNKSFEAFGLSGLMLEKRKACCSPPRPDSLKIIINRCDEPEKIERCLASLAAHTPLARDLLVVAPEEAAAQAAKNSPMAKDPGRSLLVTAAFSEALESCLREQEGETQAFIACVDANSYFVPYWLEELLRLFARFPDAGMAAPRCVMPPLSLCIPLMAPQLNSSFEADIALHSSNVLRPNIDFEGYYELERLQRFNVFLAPAGLLREYRALFDDDLSDSQIEAFCLALREEAGKKIYYSPFSKVYHLIGPDSATEA